MLMSNNILGYDFIKVWIDVMCQNIRLDVEQWSTSSISLAAV